MSNAEIYKLVEIITSSRGVNFSELLELHGISDENQPSVHKKAQLLGAGMLKIATMYAEKSGIEYTHLFASIALGMASDSALHAIISKEQSNAISERSIQAIGSGTRIVQ